MPKSDFAKLRASPRLSLIVATHGRTHELRRLLTSVVEGDYDEIEVIVVDQNPHGFLDPVLDEFAGALQLIHLHSPRGASRARNVGLRSARGEVVGFPDDDSFFPPGTLRALNLAFELDPNRDGVIGAFVDPHGAPGLPWPDPPGWVSPAVVWRRTVTFACFLRRETLAAVEGFAEQMGPGADSTCQSGEDGDLMLRVLKLGARVWHDPEIKVAHPRLFPDFSRATRNKRYRYAKSDGQVLRRHPMPLWWMSAFFAAPLLRAAAAAGLGAPREVAFHVLTAAGRARGYFLGQR